MIYKLIFNEGTTESKSDILRSPEYIEVVVSTSNAQTGEFLIVQMISIRPIRRTASSFKPKFGRFLRHSSPNGFPWKIRVLSFEAMHTEQPVAFPNLTSAFSA